MPEIKTGSTALSFTQQLLIGDPSRFVVGGKLYMYEAGITTPVIGYKDDAAQLPWPNPITLEADGRIPLITFIMASDEASPGTLVEIRRAVRMRLLDKNGVLQFDYTNVPLMTSDPGESSGGGPTPTPVDPDALYKTGDMKARYGVGSIPGFVRANGLTIGNSSSGATELANDVTANALYLYLWGADPNLVVLGGPRGPSAAADFGAGRQLVLPDFSGRALAFLDNMSGTARGILTTQTFTGLPPTTLGAQSGTERHTLAENEMPVHDHAAFINDPGHAHPPPSPHQAAAFMLNVSGGVAAFIGGATGVFGYPAQQALSGVRVKSTVAGAPDDKTSARGGGAQHLNLQPTKLVTCYIRL